MHKNIHDKTNTRYGKLLVLELDHVKKYSTKNKSNSRTFWKCLCDCGNECVVVSYNLSSGATTSCGCNRSLSVKKFHSNKSEKEKIDILVNSIYIKYKSSTKRRNIEFSISLEEFEVLIKDKCYYCHESSSNFFQRSNKSIYYNGIDRLENTIGYVSNNCVPCCKYCNRMKNDLSLTEFRNKINKIYENINL